MEKRIEFVKLLVQIRNNKRLTQNELAELLNVSRSTIAKIENLETVPSSKFITHFLDYFKKDIEEMGYNEVWLYTDVENLTFKTVVSLIKDKIKDFLTEDENRENNTSPTHTEHKKINEFSEILAAKNREIELLEKQIQLLEKQIRLLESKKN